MADRLDWGDTEYIAILLADKFPGIDPLGAGFTMMKKWVTELDQFGGNPGGATDAQLEDIRMAWHGKYNERNWDAGANPMFF